MVTRSYLTLILLAALAVATCGCAESNFELAPDSRLPKWFEVPAGMSRNQAKVTLDYYVDPGGREAVFKLYVEGRYFAVKKVTGIQRGLYPNKLANPPIGFPRGYPLYEVITADGITDVIEHRRMEPVFYVTDDPSVWKELEVEQTKAGRQK